MRLLIGCEAVARPWFLVVRLTYARAEFKRENDAPQKHLKVLTSVYLLSIFIQLGRKVKLGVNLLMRQGPPGVGSTLAESNRRMRLRLALVARVNCSKVSVVYPAGQA